MGKFLITPEECNKCPRCSGDSDLRTADDVSGLVRKRRFGIRKPRFYPLNYGNNELEE